MLTLREACKRFELYPEKIYAWTRAGILHPVRPNGRILYPEWELRDLVKPHKHSGFEYGSRAA